MQRRTIEEEPRQRPGPVLYGGVSMEPLLHNRRSTVVIERLRGRLRPGDVALYKNSRDDYVLHRVVKAVAGGYVIRGTTVSGKRRCPPAGSSA